jgi:hypothetical protein
MALRRVVGWWRDRGRTERRLLVIVGALLVLVVGVLAGRQLWRSYLIGRELARIRAAGEPASAAELRQMYVSAVGEPNSSGAWSNALAVLNGVQVTQALKGVAPYELGADDPPPPGQAWPKLQVAEAALK